MPTKRGENRKRPNSPGRTARAAVVPRVIAETQARMLDMMVSGANMREISEAFEVSRTVAARMCRDAMIARSYQLEQVTVQIARALIVDRLELVIGRVMPLATGSLTGLPDLKAVSEMVGMLKLMAQLQGVPLTGPRETKTESTTINLIAVEAMRDEIMVSLDQVEERAKVIRGSLVER